jgi:hypothetical protein
MSLTPVERVLGELPAELQSTLAELDGQNPQKVRNLLGDLSPDELECLEGNTIIFGDPPQLTEFGLKVAIYASMSVTTHRQRT